MRVKTIVKALSWAVLTAALAPANDDGGISGVVVDDKGARIANASVSYQRVGIDLPG